MLGKNSTTERHPPLDERGPLADPSTWAEGQRAKATFSKAPGALSNLCSGRCETTPTGRRWATHQKGEEPILQGWNSVEVEGLSYDNMLPFRLNR